MKRIYGRGVIVVAAGAALILFLLAYLQYTWLGQLSEEEYVRTRSTLRFAAFDCSMGFSRQMTALMKSVGGQLEGTDAAVRAEVHGRIHRWQMTGSAPMLIADSTWIAPLPGPEQAITVELDEFASLVLLKDLTAIVLPIHNRPDHGIHIAIRRAFVGEELVPALLAKASSLSRECDLAIVDGEQRILHASSGADLVRLQERPDAMVPLLTLPPGPLSTIDTNSPPFQEELRRGPDRGGGGFPPPREMRGREPGREGRPPFERGPGRAGFPELRLAYRSGPLEELVSSNRMRNLAISFGVLLLLGASVVFLIRSAGRAQELARQQLEFVAGVSHELRTPLAVLKSAGENLADGVINDQDRLRQYGALIKSEVTRLSDMVERTLAFAGIQSGKQVYELQPVDLGALVDQAVRETRKRLPAGDWTLDVSLPPDLPPVLGDLHALQSAIENLLVNALKYSPASRWVGITANPAQRDGRLFVELAITDRGMGIPQADLRRVFEPFYRGSNAVDRQVEGSGLGLSITKHAIEANGGRISVKSAVNKGSEFTILLPAASPSESEP